MTITKQFITMRGSNPDADRLVERLMVERSASRDAALYGTGVVRIVDGHAEHVPLDQFLHPVLSNAWPMSLLKSNPVDRPNSQ